MKKQTKIVMAIIASIFFAIPLFYGMETTEQQGNDIILYSPGVIPIEMDRLTPKEFAISNYFTTLSKSGFKDVNKYIFESDVPSEARFLLVDYFKKYGTAKQKDIEETILKSSQLLWLYRLANEFGIKPLLELIENNIMYNKDFSEKLTLKDLEQLVGQRAEELKKHPKLFDWQNPIIHNFKNLAPSAKPLATLQLSNNGQYLAGLVWGKGLSYAAIIDIINNEKIINDNVNTDYYVGKFSANSEFFNLGRKIYFLPEKKIIQLIPDNVADFRFRSSFIGNNLVAVWIGHQDQYMGHLTIIRIPSLEVIKNVSYNSTNTPLLYTPEYFITENRDTHILRIIAEDYQWDIQNTQEISNQDISINTDNRYLSVIDAFSLRLFNLKDKKQIYQQSKVVSCTFSTTNKYFIPITGRNNFTNKNTDLLTLDDKPQKLTAISLDTPIKQILFSKFDNYIVIIGQAGHLKIYGRSDKNPNEFKTIYTQEKMDIELYGNKATRLYGRTCILSNDEKYSASLINKTTVRIFDLKTKKEVISLDEKQIIRDFRFTDDAHHFVTVLNDGTYKIYSYKEPVLAQEEIIIPEIIMEESTNKKRKESPSEEPQSTKKLKNIFEEEEELPKNRLEDIIE